MDKIEDGLPAVLVALAKACGHTLDENWIVDIGLIVNDLDKDQILELARDLGQHAQKAGICLGAVLLAIRKKHLYEPPCKTFEEFVGTYCGFGLRQAQYMMRTFQLLAIKQIPWEKVKDVGWTKLQFVAQFGSLATIDEWIAKTKQMTVLEIKAEMQAAVFGAIAKSANPGSPAHVDHFQNLQNEIDFVGTKAQCIKAAKADMQAHLAVKKAQLVSASELLVAELEGLMLQVGREQVLTSFNKLFPAESQ